MRYRIIHMVLQWIYFLENQRSCQVNVVIRGFLKMKDFLYEKTEIIQKENLQASPNCGVGSAFGTFLEPSSISFQMSASVPGG